MPQQLFGSFVLLLCRRGLEAAALLLQTPEGWRGRFAGAPADAEQRRELIGEARTFAGGGGEDELCPCELCK
jgi:hypothetical protein